MDATVAFWLAAGAWLVALSLAPWLRQREIQRTIRAMIEKHGAIDAQTLAMIRGHEQENPARQSAVGKTLASPRQSLAGLILLASIVGGFVLLGYSLSVQPAGWVRAVWGAVALVGMVTLGLFAAWLLGRGEKKGDEKL
jgi:hypothetical protein